MFVLGENKMTVENLAIIFGPAWLRSFSGNESFAAALRDGNSSSGGGGGNTRKKFGKPRGNTTSDTSTSSERYSGPSVLAKSMSGA